MFRQEFVLDVPRDQAGRVTIKRTAEGTVILVQSEVEAVQIVLTDDAMTIREVKDEEAREINPNPVRRPVGAHASCWRSRFTQPHG